MVLTREERRAVCRRNGSRSRGPLSPETKRISSRNSLKAGLHARVHDLIDENPADNAELRAQWHRDEQPATAAEEFLVDECYHGNLMAKRYHRAHARALLSQQEDVVDCSDRDREKYVESLRQELMGNPKADIAGIIATLKTLGAGLLYLVKEWTLLGTIAENRGFWTPPEFAMAVKLMGACPGPETSSKHQDVYLPVLVEPPLTSPWCRRAILSRSSKPASRPQELRDWSAQELVQSPDESRAGLKQWVASEIASLQELAETVRTEVEQPNLANLTNLTAILSDPAVVKLFQRAAYEYRSTFYKAHDKLVASRKSAAAEQKKGTPKNTSPSESCGSAQQEDRAAGTDRDREAAVVVVPAEPVQAPSRAETASTDIGEPVTAGWIAEEASNGFGTKTEILVQERVVAPSKAIKADPQNEPHLGVFAPIETSLTVGSETPGRTSETPTPAPAAGWDAKTTEPRASAPSSGAGAAVTSQIPVPARTTEDRPMTPDAIRAREELWRELDAYYASFQDIDDPDIRAAHAARRPWDITRGVPDEAPADGEALRAPPGAGSWGW